MKNKTRYLAIIVSLLLMSFIPTLFKVGFLDSLRIVFGTFLLFFIPGYVVTSLFLKESKGIEKITLSLALSVALVPITLYYLNKIGVKITTLSAILVVVGIIFVAFAISKIFDKKLTKK